MSINLCLIKFSNEKQSNNKHFFVCEYKMWCVYYFVHHCTFHFKRSNTNTNIHKHQRNIMKLSTLPGSAPYRNWLNIELSMYVLKQWCENRCLCVCCTHTVCYVYVCEYLLREKDIFLHWYSVKVQAIFMEWKEEKNCKGIKLWFGHELLFVTKIWSTSKELPFVKIWRLNKCFWNRM